MNRLQQQRPHRKTTDPKLPRPSFTTPTLNEFTTIVPGSKRTPRPVKPATPLGREKEINPLTTLPALGESRPSGVSRSFPPTPSENNNNNDNNNNNNMNTSTLAMVEDQAKRRLQLTQTVAAHLMKAALDRQSNVLPLVMRDPETRALTIIPEDERRTEPKKKLLMAPCLGLAAGANAMGGRSQHFAVSKAEAARRIEKERQMNNVIFAWWEARNACRHDEDEMTAVEDELRGPLWSCFRESITEEEAKSMREVQRMGEAAIAIKSTTGGGVASSSSTSSSSSAFTFITTDRGISMPLELYEKMFERVMSRVHKCFLTLLQCYAKGSKDGIEISLESRSQGTKYVKFLLQSQTEMVQFGESTIPYSVYSDADVGSQDDNKNFTESYPPLVSLPEERCFRPLLSAETAFSIAILWRILDQTKTMIPGMSWALQLFTKYLLPHVYENFTSYENILPKAGALGEQVEQLQTLKLNLIRQRNMYSATKQAKDDLEYMEGFMKSWAWRSWRGSVVGQKRREKEMLLLEKVFIKLHNIIKLQKIFSEWRLTAKEGRFSAQLDEIDKKYEMFITGAQHAGRDMQLFPELEDGIINSSSAIVDKNKFVALKLAETAQHKKVKKNPISSVESNPKQEEVKDDKKDKNNDIQIQEKRIPTPKPVLWAKVHDDPLPSTQTTKKEENEEEIIFKSSNKENTFITSINNVNGETEEETALRKRALLTFDGMFKKLKEMENISGYLRQEIAIQNRVIQKLERENNNLKGKVTELEDSLFKSEERRLHFCNIVQERDIEVRELERRIVQLKSRLRCQKQRPWQRTVIRVIGDICGASTAASEYADEQRISRNFKTISANHMNDTRDGATTITTISTNSNSNNTNNTSPTTIALTVAPPGVNRVGSADSHISATQEDESADDNDDRNSTTPPAELAPGADEERLFGQIAPLVITSTRYMPDAQTILRDWANNCLEDLESLDDLKGGALSNRFHNFSDEIRNGVLLSRLLFYLALPRYQNKTAVARTTTEGLKQKMSTVLDFTEHRRNLLMQQNVQLESPFPTYSECFGDLLNLKPAGRMSLILQFATELMEGPEQLGDEYIRERLTRIRDAAIKATEMVPLPRAERVEMQETIDPYALARGDRSASITFIALLYVRFSHPFNHKARQSALIEREAMLYLLSNGTYLRREHNNDSVEGNNNNNNNNNNSIEGETPTNVGSGDVPITQKLIAQLEEEERSPWQLFLKYCQPLINTMAHPFILRGNFWPSIAFDSPDLARMLGTLGLALHRSLEEHRWHIIISCLVPVNTYSGLSRGIFTGRRASPSALQVGLDREGDWVFAIEMPCLKEILHQREVAIREAIETGIIKQKQNNNNNNIWEGEEWRKEFYFIEKDKTSLMTALGTCSNDLLQLFLQRASLSGACAMPALDLGSWRMLWIDAGLVIPDDTEHSQLDLEQLTRIFFAVTTSMMEPKKESKRESKVSESHGEFGSVESLPLYGIGLYFPDFLAAVTLLAHEMYPPISNNNNNNNNNIKGEEQEQEENKIIWIGDALSKLIFTHVASKSIITIMEEPATIVKNLRGNVKTQDVLLKHNKALLAIFGAYCKEVYGVTGMEREQLLQMLRDAMLTSTEISQNLIYELFQPFCITRKTEEAIKEDRRREQDARPRDTIVPRRRGNVSILDPNSDQPLIAGKHKEFTVLLYDGFIEFLCVLCHFKQPNPLVPFNQRLELFLRRGLIRPLAHRNESLAGILAYEKRQTNQES